MAQARAQARVAADAARVRYEAALAALFPSGATCVAHAEFGFKNDVANGAVFIHHTIERERYVGRAAAAGTQSMAIHKKATHHAQKTRQRIRDAGARAAIALNPATTVQCLDYILDDVDLVTIMTDNPGAAGQRLIPAMLRKIADARRMLDTTVYPAVEIQVDSNVSFDYIPAMLEPGATMLVGGTSSI